MRPAFLDYDFIFFVALIYFDIFEVQCQNKSMQPLKIEYEG